MNIIFLLAPFSVLLGLMAVGAFFWTLQSGQYEDIAGSAARILIDEEGESDRPALGLEAVVTSAPASAEGPDRS
jgi:cbb3-type cytochrome oxidase maturation protein